MKNRQWQRARSGDQVQQRIEEILSAAEFLYRTESFEKVTMQKIARRVGCSQSNIYRYFQNREDVFLTLYLDDAGQWLDDLEQEFSSELSPRDFASKWTTILLRHPRLVELISMLDLILEHNSSEKVYYSAKKRFKEEFPRALSTVQSALPSLSTEKATEFLYAQQAFVAGIYPMTQFSDMQKKVLSQLELHQMISDFAVFLEQTLHTYLKGLIE